MFYGQNGQVEGGVPEDQMLAEHFGDRVGRFLNVGAWNGVTFDNCRHFAERGWSGVCVEPSPAAFMELMKNYAEFPKVELVNVAVAIHAGLMPFHDCGGDAVSTLNVSNRNVWADGAGTKFRQITIAAVTVGRLIDKFGADFDLVSVDVEGGSADLIRQFPMGGMPKCKGIVVEHDGQQDRIAEWARHWGFTELARTNENLVLGR